MDPMSLAAIAVAVVVAVIGLARAAGAQKELAAVRAQLDETKAELAAAKKSLRALEAAPKAKPQKPTPKVEKKTAPAPEPKPAPKPKAEPAPEPEPEPAIDPAVLKRAEAMLRDARLMARHVGFEGQVEVKGKSGTRVPVQVESELDEQAFEHLRSTSDVVIDAGTRDGDKFFVLRG